MSTSSFLNLKATAVVAAMAVLAATAEAAGSDYFPTPATPGFLLSPVFLWVTANVIIVWLVSSNRRRGRAANDDDTAAHVDDGREVVLPGAVDSSFYASEYEAAFSDAVPVSSKRLQAREEARAARRSDRARVRKRPEPVVVQDDAPPTPPWATVVAEAQRDEPARDDRRRGQLDHQEETAPAAVSAAAAADDDDDVSLDSLWASIVQRRAARPVVVRKSESWSNEELPRLQRVAETAAARRQGVRKSVSAVAKAAAAAPTAQPQPEPEPAAAVRQTGWRTRDVLVNISPDDLLWRAESFIRRQYEQLRLQRQESEQRQLLLQRRVVHAPAPPAPLIRV